MKGMGQSVRPTQRADGQGGKANKLGRVKGESSFFVIIRGIR